MLVVVKEEYAEVEKVPKKFYAACSHLPALAIDTQKCK